MRCKTSKKDTEACGFIPRGEDEELWISHTYLGIFIILGQYLHLKTPFSSD
jgi:hypothetical protein